MTKDDAMFCLQTNEVHGVVTLGIDGEKNVDVELMGTLNTGSKSGSGQQPAVLAFTPGFVARGEGPRPMQDLVQTLGAYTQGDQAPHVLVTDVNGATTAQTLRGFGHGWQGQHNSTNAVISFQQSSLAGRGTMGVDENTAVLRPVRPQPDHQMLCLASGQANAEVVRDVVGTLDFGGHGGSYNGQDAYQGRIFPAAGRPRRLTPLECERLMGWPDRHTAQGVKEDGTAYALSDTARYRLCGNGVGAPVAAWIGQRLVAAEASCPR